MKSGIGGVYGGWAGFEIFFLLEILSLVRFLIHWENNFVAVLQVFNNCIKWLEQIIFDDILSAVPTDVQPKNKAT